MAEPVIFHSETTLGEGPYATRLRSFGGSNPFGNVWYVNSSTGSNSNAGNSPNAPLSTLAYALSVAAAGDTIILAPGFAVTLTAVLSLSLVGLSIIGIGRGTQKPTITVNAAADGLSLAAANILIDNIHFAAPETDAATAMINVAAAGCVLRNISGIGSKTAKNFVDCVTIASGADDLTIENLEIYNTTVAVNSFISIEAAVARLKMNNVFCFGDVVTAGIIDGATATHLNWANVTIGILGTTLPAIILDNNPTGLIRDSNFSGTIATLTSVAQYGNALRLFNVKSLEETDASAQGALIPAVDVN